jgi:prefoldin subunit 5
MVNGKGLNEEVNILQERIESLETAVKELQGKLDAILKEMKMFNETNAH